MQFHETKLANGLQVIAELTPSVHSVAVGFFVRTGSRDETADVSGVSHFLEHMAFKGDETYSAEDVNRIFDELGAKYNASTSEEITLFYAALLPEYLPRTFELLSTLIQPSLRESDFDIEKNVILEEIGMYDDDPGFTAYEKTKECHFAGHPLGQSILGTNESITALTAEQMQTYHAERYRAGNVFLAVTGNTTWDEVLRLANEHCGTLPPGTTPRSLSEVAPEPTLSVVHRDNSIHQHVMQMARAPVATDDHRYAAELLSVVVGDDSGSRLYWELVDPGHADAAELGYNEYDGAGTWTTYLGCQPDQTAANLERIRTIYEAINSDGITDEELEQARNKLASRVVLRSERPMGRLSSLGGNWVYREEYRSIEDDLKTIRAIDHDAIRSLLDAYPLAQTSTVTVGPLEELEFAAR